MSMIAIGKYSRVDVENIEEMLTALEVNYFFQTIATTCSPEMTVTEEDGTWIFKTTTIYSEFEMSFRANEPFDFTTPDGRDVTCIAAIEDDKFIFIQTAKNEGEKSTKIIKEFNISGCIVTIELIGEDIKCSETYQRI